MHAVQNIANVVQCYSLLSGQYDIKEFLGLNCWKYIYVLGVYDFGMERYIRLTIFGGKGRLFDDFL